MTRRRSRSLRVALAATITVVTACAGAPAPEAVTPLTVTGTAPGAPAALPQVHTVGVIGDSITVGAEEEIRLALGDLAVEVVVVDAEVGRRLTIAHTVDAGLDAARRVRRLDPDLWVVALGTNDVWSVGDGADAGLLVDEMLAAIPPDVPLVWVDVFVEGAEDASDIINLVVHQRLGQRGDATVASWSEVAAGSDLLADGVHPTDAGDVAFAGVVARGVSSWLG